MTKYVTLHYVQGSANPLTPGSENIMIKSCVFMPVAGGRAELFILIFSGPGVCGLANPCMSPSLVQESDLLG